jgi:hypothetical protein
MNKQIEYTDILNEENDKFVELLNNMNFIQTYIRNLNIAFEAAAEEEEKESLRENIITKCNELKTIYDDMLVRILNNELLQLYFSRNVTFDSKAMDDDKVINSVFTNFTNLKAKLNKNTHAANIDLFELIFNNIKQMHNIQTDMSMLKKSLSPTQTIPSAILHFGGFSSKQKYLKYKNKCLRLKN